MRRVIRWISGLLIVAMVVGGLGLLVVLRVMAVAQEPENGSGTRAVAVEVAEVERGLIRDVRRFTGTLRARSQVDVAPRISGRIATLAVDIGDVVERGQLIARLDDEEYVQEVEAARADLMVTEATLEEKRSALVIAERDYERVQRLREQRIASESELDAARSRYEAERAAVKVAEAERSRREAALRSAQVRLSYTVIRATWEAGGETRVVGERFVDEGATVSANSPIVSLLDIQRLVAVVFVTERDYTPLRIGLAADVQADSNPGRLHEGRIIRMAPAFEEGSRQARIEIDVDNPDHVLKPGMFVRCRLEIGRADDAQIVPRRAVIQRDGRTGVFVVDREAMTARFVEVRQGIRHTDRVQITEPVLDGPVVVLGQHLLSDGASVMIPEAETREAARAAGDEERG